MKLHKTFWALPLLGILATPAIADRYYDDGYHHASRFEQRIDRQHRRIERGLRSGELTRKEAKRLRKQLRQIAKLERRYTRDAFLDRHERRKLHNKLNVASERIYRLKHNDRYGEPKRHGHYYGYGDSGWTIFFNLSDSV